jgi:two-component system CheB/CheR fusion protein
VAAQRIHRTGSILLIESDPHLCEHLELVLKDEGHHTATAPDGHAALEMVARGAVRPDLIVADYDLQKGMDGLTAAEALRQRLDRRIPAIVLIGENSTDTSLDVARHDCVQLEKPTRLRELTGLVQRLLVMQTAMLVRTGQPRQTPPGPPVVFIVDDDGQVRNEMRAVLEDDGRTVEAYPTPEAFLEAYRPGQEACLLVDAHLSGTNRFDLLKQLRDMGEQLPVIVVTGQSDVPMAVQAMKAGASDLLEKPISRSELVASVRRALERSHDSNQLVAWRENAASRIARLTPRQRQIMHLILAGHPSKIIAADLGISQRTVETHRASIMKTTGAKSLPALARLTLAAASLEELLAQLGYSDAPGDA